MSACVCVCARIELACVRASVCAGIELTCVGAFLCMRAIVPVRECVYGACVCACLRVRVRVCVRVCIELRASV